MSILTRLIPDRFVLMLLLTVAVAAVLPVTGQAAVYAGYGVSVAIFLLFFLHGLRLPRAEVIVAMKNWRLQGLIFAFTFAFMPLLGLVASQAPAGLLPHGLVIGLLFLGILPSTVQSAISYSSLAGGNIAASVMASALLNLAGIIMTPLLVALLCAIILLMLVLAMCAAWGLGGLLGLPRADRISLLYAGSHKSIATGAPLAAILFAGPQAGIVILPALIYHQLQLVLSAPLASRLAKHAEA